MDASDNAYQLISHIGKELKLLWWQMEAWQSLFLIEQDKRHKLIQQTAPGFFAIVQITMTESILMRIFRLMDKTKIKKNYNSSFQRFLEVLSDEDTLSILREEIQAVLSEWELETGPYANLKIARNKWLAHNDFDVHKELDSDQLWMPLTSDDFVAAQRLAAQLWGLYTDSVRKLRGVEVLEPIHSNLDNRSVMILKHLCTSLYLDQVLGDDSYKHENLIRAIEAKFIGEDSMPAVFASIT